MTPIERAKSALWNYEEYLMSRGRAKKCDKLSPAEWSKNSKAENARLKKLRDVVIRLDALINLRKELT